MNDHQAAGVCPEAAAAQPAPTVTDAEVDQHLDAVLKASGSALRYYTTQKTLDDMRAAMRRAMAAARA